MRNLLFVLLFTPLAAFAHQGNPSLEAIATALSTGDVQALSKYFAETVEVSILEKEQVLNKAKATEVVRSFFESSKPKSFAQVHKGSSRENSDQYCIGNLSANSGNYRVYIYLKSGNNAVNIQEIRFDKE